MARYLIGNIKGPAGEDGFSPSASVVQTNSGATITITDANGTTTANIRNGVDGDGNNIDLSPYATKEDLTIMGASISAAGYATEDYVENAVQNINIPVQSVNGMVGDVVVAIPDISDLATEDYVDAAVANVNVDLTGYATEQYVANAIADVNGFSGDYDDLTNKPDLSDMVHASDLADVALTGSFTDLLNVPDIPAAQVNADWNAAGGKAQILNKPTIPAADGTTIVDNNGVWSAVGGGSSFSGDYDDLTNKPDLSVYATNSALAAKQDTLTAGTNITIDANNVISATGGSNYGDADVAEYIEDTFGMAKTSVPSGTQTYSFNNIPLTTKTLLDTAAITMPPISPARPLVMDQVDIWGSNGLLTSIAAQNWVSISGGGNPAQWEYVISPENDSSVSLTIGASSADGYKIYLKDFTCSYADAQSYSGAFDITVPAHTEVSTLQTQFIPIDNSTIRVNSNGKLEAQSSGGGTTYTAGNGIEIFNDEISVDTDVIPVRADLANYATQTQLTNGLATKQDTLTNGTGVYINNNQINVDVMALLNAGTGITLSDYDNSISIDNSVVALKSDIPAANTYGDADVADYISDTFGMGVSDAGPTLWGQTSDPQYIGEDSTVEITLTGSGSSDPFQNGGNTQYPVEFEIRQNSNDELVSSVNDTFLSSFIGSEYSPVYHFSSEDGNKSFDLGYYSDAWWLSETTVSGYSQGYHVSNFKLYLPTSGTVKTPIDEDFIPSTIARVSDIPADELPTISSGDAGKVLTVNSGETGVEWTTPSGGGSGSSPVVYITENTAAGWAPIGLQAKNAHDNNYDGSLLPKIVIWRQDVYTLSSINNFYNGGGGLLDLVYAKNTSYPTNRYSNSISKIDLGQSFVCFTVAVNDGSISNFYRPYGSGTVITTNMVDTGLTYSNNGYLQVNTNLIARKQDVPTTSANAVSAIYLKDTNNVKYQITVDTNGNLTATAVSNS